MYACDPKCWEHYKPAYDGLRVCQDARASEFGAYRMPGVDEPGLSLDPHLIHFGANSGYQALNLALHFGARRVLLLGFDMQPTNGRLHWHPDHPTGLNNPDETRFALWNANFGTVRPDLEKAGVEVVNCSRETALTCFPRASIRDALCGLPSSDMDQAHKAVALA